MHQDLTEAIAFHHAILAEGGKALVGYEAAKTLANVVLLIPNQHEPLMLGGNRAYWLRARLLVPEPGQLCATLFIELTGRQLRD